MTARLPPVSGLGKALRRSLVAAGVDASCSPADVWVASRLPTPPGRKPLVSPRRADVVAWPETAEEVAAVVAVAVKAGVPITAAGGATGSTGGAVPARGGIVLDTRRLIRPVHVDARARIAELGAGLTAQRIDRILGEHGMTLGCDAVPQSTLGGWLATRTAGERSSRYGTLADRTLTLEAVDGSGEIIRTQEGSGLSQLLLGSEGTLVIFTSARLRVAQLPCARWARTVRFPTLAAGLKGLRTVVAEGLRPAIARLHDPAGWFALSRVPARIPAPLRRVLAGAGGEALRLSLLAPGLLNRVADALPLPALLTLAFEGDDEDGCAIEGAIALDLCREARGVDAGPVPPRLPAPRGAPAAREAALDVATTWDRAESVIREVRRAVHDLAFARASIAHAAPEGCAIEFTFLGGTDPETQRGEGRSSPGEVVAAALSAAADAGASLSHHSGIGAQRQLLLPRELGEGMRQLRALKSAFDPHRILNPGKLLL